MTNLEGKQVVESSPIGSELPKGQICALYGGFLAVCGVLILLTVSDYGVSWDEFFRWAGGDRKLEYYQALISGNSERSAEIRAEGDSYPGFFDLPAAFIRSVFAEHSILASHLWQAFFGWLGIAGAMALGYRLGGAWVGLAAGFLLVLFPRYWGHQFINPKDIPFAATYIWGLWALVRSMQVGAFRERWPALVFGLLAGACMASRIGGLLLFCYAGLFAVLQVAVEWRTASGSFNGMTRLKEIVVWFFVAGVPAFLILLVFWPAAHRNPFSQTESTIADVSDFGWEGQVLFHGERILAADLPRTYLPDMIFRSSPDLWLVLALMTVAILIWDRRWLTNYTVFWSKYRTTILVLFAAAFPIAFIMVKGAVVYDGMRHVLFIIPLASVLLGLALVSFVRRADRQFGKIGKWIVSGLVGLLSFFALWDSVQLHPYQYTYYNRLTGGVSAADGRFENDYWGTAYREGAELISAGLPPREGGPWRITMEPPLDVLQERIGQLVVPPPTLVAPFLEDHVVLVRGNQRPEFYIATTRNAYHEMRPEAAVAEVTRDGVVLLQIKPIKNQ
ncbi:MAG: hypothetical protein AAFX93_17815 [Verrucomicrobiota bacterium]